MAAIDDTAKRGLAALVVSLAAVFPAAAVDVPALDGAVAQAIERAGDARGVDGNGALPGLAPDPAIRALAAARIQQARGAPGRARERLIAVLRRRPAAADADLTAALYRALVEAGPGEEGRALLLAADSGSPGQLARAWDLARVGSCETATQLVDAIAAKIPPRSEPLLLAADALDRCGQPAAALALLQRAGPPGRPVGTSPRIALRVGELELRIGDADSAALWCAVAARAFSQGVPDARRAEVCGAAADALRGRLPAARESYIDARASMLRSPALPPDLRVQAGLAAAWSALGAMTSSGALRARKILEEVNSLRPRGEFLLAQGLLTAHALTLLEQNTEAQRQLTRLRPGRGASSWLRMLESVVRAQRLARAGDEVGSSSLLAQAVEEARRANDPLLLSLAQMARAQTARWEGRHPLARVHAAEALAAWPGADFRREAWFLADPVLPRRALEVALGPGLGTRSTLTARAQSQLEEAERLRLSLLPLLRLGGESGRPDVSRVRRYLAARNSGLLTFLIGETRTFAWLVEPGAVRAVELPSGDELYKQSGRLLEGRVLERDAQPASAVLIADLLSSYSAEQGLMILPDGFLSGLPWGALPPPAALGKSTGAARLDQALDIALAPSLGAIVDPAGTRQIDEESAPGFAALLSQPLPGLPAPGAVPKGWGSVRRYGPGGEIGKGQLEELRRQRGVLHLGLPLISLGRGTGELRFATAGSVGQGRAPIAAEDLFSSGQPRDVVGLAPGYGWALAPASRVRAAFRLTALGARSVVVPLTPQGTQAAESFWPAFYDELASGSSKAAALREGRAALVRRKISPLPEFALIGYGDTLVTPAPNESWPFWASLGAGLLILAIVLVRLMWPKRDPFDLEPPEE